MSDLKNIIKLFTVFLLIVSTRSLSAQGYGRDLTFQRLDHYALHSAVGRAMGGITIGVQKDVALMFQNPATLQSLDGIAVSIGGQTSSTDLKQEQNYAPVRYYSNLSLLLEGLTAVIPDPDSTLPGFTAQDTVQRPFDDIEPNWTRSKSKSTPLQALLAVPLQFGNLKVVGGIGVVNYADLTNYFQNNNVLSPGILSQRPLPTFRPTDDNPIEVDWSQSIRSREGSLRGYGLALAGALKSINLSIGFSAMLLRGSTDDFESELARGKLTFFSNAFRADSVYRKITRSGKSDFRGREFTLASTLSGRYVSVGFSVKPPVEITRRYTLQVTTDTTGTPSSSTLQGEDKLRLPWRGTVGLSLTPAEKLTVGIEYELRPYDSVKYMNSEGTETSPWLSASLFRLGIEYRIASWLALRGGLRGEAEVFEAEGNKIEGEPVKYTVYSGGLGFSFSGLRFDLTYENGSINYQDIWASAISMNNEKRHTFVAQLTYEIPTIP